MRARVFTQFRDRAGPDARARGGVPVTFQADHDGGAEVDPEQETVETGDDGEATFAFTADQTGTVTITMSVPGRAGNFEVGDGDTAQVQVDVVADGADAATGDSAAIAGTVTDTEGNPVDNAEVRLVLSDETFVQTDDQGDYRFGDLTAGDYIVHVEDIPGADNFDCDPDGHNSDIDLDAGEERDDVDFVCDLEPSQEGT